MASYKVIDADQLDADLGVVADAIRAKGGTTAALTFPEGFEAAVENLADAPEAVAQATPSITVSSTGLITATAQQTEGYVEGGTATATKQLTTRAGTTITPGTSSKVAANSNVYTTGTVYVQGDSELVAGNIKSGISIFGVTGTYEGASLPALSNPGTASDLLSGKQLISQDGEIVTGTITSQASATITPGTSTKVAVSSNRYTTGTVYVQGDADLVAGNIKSGVSIFGVTGTYTGSGSSGAAALPSGFTEIKGGTVVYAEKTKNISVEHGLSGVPKGAVFYREGADALNDVYLNWAYIFPFPFYNTSTHAQHTGMIVLATHQTVRNAVDSNVSIDETSFSVYTDTYNYNCKAGTTYRWLAWR